MGNVNQRNNLLKILKDLYRTNCIPPKWKIADIIPILKPRKNPADPISGRPITLLSVTRKLREGMISKRLRWFLDNESNLSPLQFGFRNNYATLYPLAILDHETQVSFKNLQKTLVVTLDLSTAFDRADTNSIIYKLASCGLKGYMLKWLENYMEGIFFSLGTEQSLGNTEHNLFCPSRFSFSSHPFQCPSL